MSDGLKPCPFCGYRLKFEKIHYGEIYYKCSHCNESINNNQLEDTEKKSKSGFEAFRRVCQHQGRQAGIKNEIQGLCEMKKMRFDKAIRVLRRFQDWRTGIDCRTLADTGFSPGELTAAIDAVLKRHGMPEPLTDCRV